MSHNLRKNDVCICENKGADQLCSNSVLISALVFSALTVLSLFFLNPKYQTSSHFLWVRRQDYFRPGRNSKGLFFLGLAQIQLASQKKMDSLSFRLKFVYVCAAT